MCTALGIVARKAAWPCFARPVIAQKRQHTSTSGPLSSGRPSHGIVFHKVRAAPGSQTTSSKSPGALSPDEWRAFKVIEKKQLTDNTANKVSFVRFGLPDPNQTIGLFVASCLMTRAPIGPNNEYIIRPYTPVSRPDTTGYFDLVIKVYPQGNMSKHIGSLKVGDSLEFKGPAPKLPYRPNMKKKIGMIAGGSGITPMLQVAEEILLNPEDTTEVSLIYANQTENDIILKDKLDEMNQQHARFHVFYVVDRAIAEAEWKGGVGYITSEIIKEHMPGPEEDSLVLVCGPPPMMKAISGDKAPDKSQGELTGILASMGYTTDGVFKF